MVIQIDKMEIKDELRVCPSCGYGDGFHSMFKRDGELIRWLFICPSCHKIFDTGFKVPLFLYNS